MSRSRAVLAAGAISALFIAVLVWRYASAPEPGVPQGAPSPSGEPVAMPRTSAAPPSGLPVQLTQPTTATDGSGCAFSGRVVSSATGAGVPRAELTFSRSGEANAIDAGDDGSFCFEPRQPGRWTLASAVAPGFLPFAPEWGHSPVQLDAREGARVHGIVVTLVPELRYTGRVVDPAGRPVAGAEVRVIAAGGGETAGMPLPGRFVSDENGAFEFAAPEGSELEARHPPYGPGRARVEFAVRVSRHVTIALTEPGDTVEALAISGRVEGADGNPAEGTLVVAYSTRTDRDTTPRQATADAGGRFAIQDLPLGPWRIVASRPGFAPAVAENVRAGSTDLVLHLRAGGRLRGDVRDKGGGPVTPFTVRVRWRGKDRFLPPRTLAVVDASGQYEIDGLVPGPALAMVSAPGRSPSQEVELTIPEAGEQPAVADFDLAPGGRVVGLVMDAATSAPLAGAQVEVESQAGGPSAIPAKSSGTSGPDGRFAIGGVPGGRPLSLYAHAEGHHARVITGIVVPEAGESAPVSIALSTFAQGEDPRVEVNGIGAVLAAQGTDALRVVSVNDGSGAAEAGLAPGDEVVRIDGLAVAELSFAKALKLIHDAEGGSVVLAVRKANDAARVEQRVVVHQEVSHN